MFSTSLSGLDRKQLRRWLALFFLALALPTGILVYQAYSQLKWEAFHQHRVLAEELVERIDSRLVELIATEEARSFSDYSFLNVAGDPAANFLQRSPLSAWPHGSSIPGLVGHFQVDTRGAFTTPLLPPPGAAAASYGISDTELQQRLALQAQIEQILSRNRLVQDRKPARVVAGNAALADEARTDGQISAAAPSAAADRDVLKSESSDDQPVVQAMEEPLAGQAAFDQLNKSVARPQQKKKTQASSTLGRVKDLKLDQRYQKTPQEGARPRAGSAAPATKLARKERAALPEPAAEASASSFDGMREADAPTPRPQRNIRIRTFESEIDPFEFSQLDSGHFVLFRKVWRDGARFIQGAVIEQQPFLQGMIESIYLDTALSGMSDLLVAWRGDVFSVFSGRAARDYLASTEELNGTLLYQSRLSAPLAGMELILSIKHLPAGAGARVVGWLAAILLLVLCGGFYLMFRLGAGQIDLARQQQDFVSAVSHELKTPLTSIRMYGEMLREGWVSDEKKKTCYDFIFDESERLSRLITNVLQLARMTRNQQQIESRPVSVAGLMDGVRSRVASQVERAGFVLNMHCESDAGQTSIEVDEDALIQVFINLVDNALKFSAAAQRKQIDINGQRLRDGSVLFSVRDYGPGIPADQMKKIFRLFYRSEDELTRETVGTGIGLALVSQLAKSMGGRVDVVNRDPGAEFQVSFTGQA